MKSRQRVIDHGEVFTPTKLVNDMLDLVAHECERIDSRFLEPACGDGNFLAEVLTRKLRTVNARHRKSPDAWGRAAFTAVTSLYGIDLLPDNVQRCRSRLLHVVDDHLAATFKAPPQPADRLRGSIAFVLSLNIVHGDALTLKTAPPLEHPIVFAEWSEVRPGFFKRRDFTFFELLEPGDFFAAPLSSDTGHPVFVPKPVRDWPLVAFLDLPQTGGKH